MIFFHFNVLISYFFIFIYFIVHFAYSCCRSGEAMDLIVFFVCLYISQFPIGCINHWYKQKKKKEERKKDESIYKWMNERQEKLIQHSRA